MHTGSLTHADGSAVIRVGDTAAVCGVRAETLLVKDVAYYQPKRGSATMSTDGDNGNERETKRRKLREESEEMAHLNLLVPNLELATGCSPAHMPGAPPSTLAQTLSQRLLTLLHSSRLVDMDDLRIWYQPPKADSADKMEEDDVDEEDTRPSVKAFWTLYIDVLFISLDGNPFDAAWGAMLAALKDVRLPRAWWDADREMVLCDDDASLAKPLTLRGLPMPATFAVFAGAKKKETWVLADPDGFEEGICDETVTVVVRKRKHEQNFDILGIETTSGVGKGAKEMYIMVELAQERWNNWSTLLHERDGEATGKQAGGREELDEKARKRKDTEERVRIKMEKLGMPPLKSSSK